MNSYRRFLIHKVCESVSQSQPKTLTTFSIGFNQQRRTVVCQPYQLLVDPKHDSLKKFVNIYNFYSFATHSHLIKYLCRTQESQFAWSYLQRNSVPKSSMGFEPLQAIDGSEGKKSLFFPHVMFVRCITKLIRDCNISQCCLVVYSPLSLSICLLVVAGSLVSEKESIKKM